MQEERIKKSAQQWARANKKRLKASFCDPTVFVPQKTPVTIFMAGTPGAGKTEFSKNLVQIFGNHIVRIDADEIRDMMKEIGYNGQNSLLYQNGVGIAVNDLYRSSIKQRQSVLIDGTFAYSGWRANIDMSLADNRPVEIYYLYQEPRIAWDFVKKREAAQGRVVPRGVFVKDYATSIDNVCKAKEVYGDKVTIYYAKNNYQKSLEYVKINVGLITDFIPHVYNSNELESMIVDDQPS
jgi:predicted ABC-type ATPase